MSPDSLMGPPVRRHIKWSHATGGRRPDMLLAQTSMQRCPTLPLSAGFQSADSSTVKGTVTRCHEERAGFDEATSSICNLRADPSASSVFVVFNITGGKVVMILVLALVVLGPEKLPEAMRKFGEFYAQFKKMSTAFQAEMQDTLGEPLRELRGTADLAKGIFDQPLDELKKTTDAFRVAISPTLSDTPRPKAAPMPDIAASSAPQQFAGRSELEVTVPPEASPSTTGARVEIADKYVLEIADELP